MSADGYVSNVDYTVGYYPELNAERAKLSLLFAGIMPPVIKSACELGFGQGLSLNFNGASTDIKWYGNDYNSSHVAFARKMNNVFDGDTSFSELDFKSFCKAESLPNFDFISMHGVWSWISDENRNCIRDFIREKLNPGGIVYISYNTDVGWSSVLPLRSLMYHHANHELPSGNGIENNIAVTLKFFENIMDADSKYFKQNIGISERLKLMLTQRTNYVAHEYFNKDWKPMNIVDVASFLKPAKLSFGASANFIDHVKVVNTTEEQSEILAGITDNTYKQAVRDLMTGTTFRKEYWVKGVKRLSKVEREELIDAIYIVMAVGSSVFDWKIKGPRGEAELDKEIYGALIDECQGHKVHKVGALWKSVSAKIKITKSQFYEAIFILISKGVLSSCNPHSNDDQILKDIKYLNAFIINQAHYSAEIPYLLSPLTGVAVAANRMEQLFLEAYKNKIRDVDGLAGHAHSILIANSEKLIVDGKPLVSNQDNLEELKKQAKKFLELSLNVFNKLAL